MMELYGLKTGRMSMMCRTVVFTYTLALAAMAGTMLTPATRAKMLSN